MDPQMMQLLLAMRGASQGSPQGQMPPQQPAAPAGQSAMGQGNPQVPQMGNQQSSNPYAPPVVNFQGIANMAKQNQQPPSNPADPNSWKTTVTPGAGNQSPQMMAKLLQAFGAWGGA